MSKKSCWEFGSGFYEIVSCELKLSEEKKLAEFSDSEGVLLQAKAAHAGWWFNPCWSLHSWVFMGRFNDNILLHSGLGMMVIEYMFSSFHTSQIIRLKTCLWWSYCTVQRRMHKTERMTRKSWPIAWPCRAPGTGKPSHPAPRSLLYIYRHFIFRNGNIIGKQSFENGISLLGSGTSNHPESPGWQLLGTQAKSLMCLRKGDSPHAVLCGDRCGQSWGSDKWWNVSECCKH